MTRSRRIPLLLHRQVQVLLSRLTSFFATYSSQFFNFLAIPCMIFLEEPISQFQFSIQTNLISLSLICSWTCLMYVKSRRFTFLIDLLTCEIRISLFPISRLNLSLSLIIFLLSFSLSSDGQVNFPFKDHLEIFFCLSTNAQRLCLDLLSS